MRFIESKIYKIALLLIISLLVFTGWQYGGENIYANFLVEATNTSLGVIKEGSHVDYEKKDGSNHESQFVVHAIIDGRNGSYPQKIGGLLQPFVIILSWQIFLFFIINKKSAFISLAINFVVFTFVQGIFLFLLTGYYTSDIQKYVFTSLMDSFYIIALILIIKDNIIYSVLGTKKVKSDRGLA